MLKLRTIALAAALLVCTAVFGQEQKISCLPPGCPPLIFTPTRTLTEYPLNVPGYTEMFVPSSAVFIDAYAKVPGESGTITALTMHDEQPPWKPGGYNYHSVYVTVPGTPVPMNLDLRHLATIVTPSGVYVVFDIFSILPVPANCQIIDATGWAPGNVSTDDRIMSSLGGVVVSYRFGASQLGQQGRIELAETMPGPQFEISATSCDMSLPLPIAGDAASWQIPARLGAPGDRYPRMIYASVNPALGVALLPSPDAGGFLYVNVRQAVDSQYLLWYWPQ